MKTLKNVIDTISGQPWGPASVISAVVTSIGVIVGGVVCITDPSTLSFSTYLQDLAIFGGGTGLLAIGRGLHLAGTTKLLPAITIEANPPGSAAAVKFPVKK